VRGILAFSSRSIWKSNTDLEELETWRVDIGIGYIIKEDYREGANGGIERKVSVGLIVRGIVFTTTAY
jgi:hypothetical protein